MRGIAIIGVLLAGCQELPPGVLAGGGRVSDDETAPQRGVLDSPVVRDRTEADRSLRELDRRLARLEALATGPDPAPASDTAALRAQVRELTAALAATRQRLAASDRVLAEAFGRRAEITTQVAADDPDSVIR